MKYRISTVGIAVQALSLSLLTGCGGGGSNNPGTPPAPPVADHAPTVSLNAPTNAAVGIPFPISWSSKLATSCAADFDGSTATEATIQRTEATPGSKTYTVSCTGTGGTTTKTVTVELEVAAAEGRWDGSIDDNADGVADRTTTGIVTREGTYWILYYNGAGNPSGFYTGTGTATAGSFPSDDLRQFNFEGGFAGGTSSAAQGKVTSTYTHPTGLYSTASTLNGSFNSVPPGSPTNYAVTASGMRNYHDSGNLSISYNGTWDAAANAGSWVGTGTIGSFGISGTFNQTFTMNEATGAGVLAAMTGCTDTVSGAVCGGLAGVFIGPIRNNSNAFDQYAASKPSATGTSFVPVDGGNYVWSFYVEDPYKAVTDPDTGDTSHYFTKYDLNVTLMLLNLPSISDASFTSNYNPVYEQTPSLTTLAGSYTGTAGLGSSTAGGTLVVASDGTLTGSAGSCSYSANIDVHETGGNVYDISSLRFSGGGCVYPSSDPFTGSAQYDAATKKITVTALNATRNKGFMFVGTKP